MDDATPRAAEYGPLLVTCVGLIAMGLFCLAASRPEAGWLFVGFGAVMILVTAARMVRGAVRDRRR